MAIAMESTATVRMDYTSGLWRFLNNTAERVAFDMSADPGLRVGGQKVVGKRAAALPPPGDRSRFCNHAPERAAGSPLRIRRRRASAFHVRAICI
jgi:hypothetical protein